jgi:hypothetical protein
MFKISGTWAELSGLQIPAPTGYIIQKKKCYNLSPPSYVGVLMLEPLLLHQRDFHPTFSVSVDCPFLCCNYNDCLILVLIGEWLPTLSSFHRVRSWCDCALSTWMTLLQWPLASSPDLVNTFKVLNNICTPALCTDTVQNIPSKYFCDCLLCVMYYFHGIMLLF